MTVSSLFAKSARGSRHLSLLAHLRDTDVAAQELFLSGTRWANSFLRFFKLEPGEHETFLLHLRVASLFHDIGKANEDFQRAISWKGFCAQSFRHEHLSALLLCHPPITSWLASSGRLDVDLVVAAVLTHHLKAASSGDWQVLQPTHRDHTRLFFDHMQIRDALALVAEAASLPPLDAPIPSSKFLGEAWLPALTAVFDRANRFFFSLKSEPRRLRLSSALKAGLIASDSVASGTWREELGIRDWVQGVAHRKPLRSEEINRDVIDKRIESLGARWQDWHGFQKGVATVGRRGLILAGCGAGKTMAAWRWASTVAKSEQIGRVVFLYPTRGTATEGFRDYVGHAPEADAALVHGSSDYELNEMQANPEEQPLSVRGKNFGDEQEARLFSLGLWNRRYFSATVDQFLGFIENNYRGLCLLPALADSAVIFDEVHSYDRRMWNALVAFLERFDVPVLCMTATLPPARRERLQRSGLRAYPNAEEVRALADLEEKDTCLRYRIEGTDLQAALEAAIGAVEAGQRVLWVVNTVARCQNIARTLRDRLETSSEVWVYHSRFKLVHRQKVHEKTIEAFRAPLNGEPAPAIAVTTQVCEMSLDLDADLLITEYAPISSLIQRFGRANRHLRRGAAFRARLLVYEPESSLPYQRPDLDAARSFLSTLDRQDVSQRRLAEELEKHSLAERTPSGWTSFLEGGYFAVSGDLRDSDDYGAQVVLDGDVETFRDRKRRREPTDGLILTVPKKYAASSVAGLPPWLKIAEQSRYDEWLGFIADDTGK